MKINIVGIGKLKIWIRKVVIISKYLEIKTDRSKISKINQRKLINIKKY